MKKDDWITELYYKQLSDKVRDNRNSREIVSSKKEISKKKNKFRNRGCSKDIKAILPL